MFSLQVKDMPSDGPPCTNYHFYNVHQTFFLCKIKPRFREHNEFGTACKRNSTASEKMKICSTYVTFAYGINPFLICAVQEVVSTFAFFIFSIIAVPTLLEFLKQRKAVPRWIS